jgi:hypothetical protein
MKQNPEEVLSLLRGYNDTKSFNQPIPVQTIPVFGSVPVSANSTIAFLKNGLFLTFCLGERLTQKA